MDPDAIGAPAMAGGVAPHAADLAIMQRDRLRCACGPCGPLRTGRAWSRPRARRPPVRAAQGMASPDLLAARARFRIAVSASATPTTLSTEPRLRSQGWFLNTMSCASTVPPNPITAYAANSRPRSPALITGGRCQVQPQAGTGSVGTGRSGIQPEPRSFPARPATQVESRPAMPPSEATSIAGADEPFAQGPR